MTNHYRELKFIYVEKALFVKGKRRRAGGLQGAEGHGEKHGSDRDNVPDEVFEHGQHHLDGSSARIDDLIGTVELQGTHL